MSIDTNLPSLEVAAELRPYLTQADYIAYRAEVAKSNVIHEKMDAKRADIMQRLQAAEKAASEARKLANRLKKEKAAVWKEISGHWDVVFARDASFWEMAQKRRDAAISAGEPPKWPESAKEAGDRVGGGK